jgi:thioredoxin reductase (NADPH)
VVEITSRAVVVEPAAGGPREEIPAEAVLAMTGYYANTELLSRLGVAVDPVTGIPAHDEATMQTPVSGCYLAGVIASGKDANRLFIENARGHGEVIVREVVRQGGK